MSDLISRSQLLKEIETWGGCVEALHEYIRNMPTAYDVDKVVEQLKDESKKCLICELPTCKEDESHCCYCNGLNKAIEIVKAGGNIELSEHSKSQGN